MSIEVFNGTSIPRELTTAAMEFLWAKWRTLKETNSLSLSRLTEESDFDLRPSSIYMVSVGDDFAYMYVGAAFQAAIGGRVLAGSLLSASTHPIRRDFAEIYRQVARRMAPAFIRFTGTLAQSGRIWHRLVLPIPLGDDRAILLIYSELIDHQTEVYEHLFRTAPDAMVIACPIVNDVGHTTDGWVLMMNDRARELLRYDGSLGNLRLAQLPQFAGIDLWGRLYAPKFATSAMPVTTADFDIEILRFPHAFGLRLQPKSPVIDSTAATLVPDRTASGLRTPV